MIAEINKLQITKVAKLIKELPETGNGLNFYSFVKDGKEIVASDNYPPISDYPYQTINFFFFICVHDYGFWYGDDRGYFEPLYGTINGARAKGSDLLWKVCMKAFDKDVMRFEPYRLSAISPMELAKIFSDDNGPIPFPDFGLRFAATRAFGRWFVKEKTTPSKIVETANENDMPLNEFLFQMRIVPGYSRDPLQKRNLLLAMALANRPEKFLDVKDPENWKPIVDYHLMRLSLRLGLVILDKSDEYKNKKREWVSADTEDEIRRAVFKAVLELIQKSGRPMSFIDEKMWMARKYCPEMEVPNCAKCIFTSVCKKRIALFQPIIRTTAY